MPTSNPPDLNKAVAELTLEEAAEVGVLATENLLKGYSADTCINELPEESEEDDD